MNKDPDQIQQSKMKLHLVLNGMDHKIDKSTNCKQYNKCYGFAHLLTIFIEMGLFLQVIKINIVISYLV